MDIELGVSLGRLGDVLEELRRKDEVPLLFRNTLAGTLRFLVGKADVGETGVARLALARVDILGQVLGDEAVEEEAEDVRLEVPAVNGAAHLVGYSPDRLVELGALGFLVARD